MIYTVPLGHPFLSVSQERLSDEKFNQCAVALMSKWVGFDRLIVIRILLRVASFEGVNEWFTNDCNFTANLQMKAWMAWSPSPGQNVNDICGVFEPVITNLGTHLQHQDDLAAYLLIPALEWLQSSGRLSVFGEGLLKGLKETQAHGKSPRPTG